MFVFIGLDPNTDFLKGSSTSTTRGFVATDPMLMTSLPGVFAAGDVRDGSTKQLASAVGEGAAVAIQIRGFLERQLSEAVHPGGGETNGPEEIFELIIKADEKLKYSNEANMDLRKQQAIDLLTQARDAATDAGNDALVQQAETRLADLGATR